MGDQLRDLNEAGAKVSTRVPYQVSHGYLLADHMVTTAFTLDGYRIVRNLGIVRGITVRSRSIVGNFVAGLQTIVGGNITMLTKLCETARSEAYSILVQHATEMGANAIIGMRYDATEVMNGVTEVLAYGTAVVVESIDGSSAVR